MPLMRWGCAALTIGMTLLGGCATQSRSDLLTTTLTAYASAMRWGDFPSALKFVDPEVLKTHTPSSLDMARYAQVKVTGYDEGSGPLPLGDGQVQQVVQLNLINNNTQTERSVVDHQVWRYDAVNKHWWLETGLPAITAP